MMSKDYKRAAAEACMEAMLNPGTWYPEDCEEDAPRVLYVDAVSQWRLSGLSDVLRNQHDFKIAVAYLSQSMEEYDSSPNRKVISAAWEAKNALGDKSRTWRRADNDSVMIMADWILSLVKENEQDAARG